MENKIFKPLLVCQNYYSDISRKRKKYILKFYEGIEKFRNEFNKATNPEIKKAIFHSFNEDFIKYLMEEFFQEINYESEEIEHELILFNDIICKDFVELKNEFKNQIENM